jgi:hypothetical protein
VRVALAMVGGHPAFRFDDRGRTIVVFADSGRRFAGFTRDSAIAETARAYPEHATTLAYDAKITEPDQWSLQTRALLPMHRIALGDAVGTVVYLSDVSGQFALRTTARERRIAYTGAVLHWLYFTPLRKHGPLWNQVIIWTALAGSVMCVLGLVWGFYLGVRTPYRGWIRWHHYTGLAFGIVSLTWVFSGLLSVDPWDWHPSTAPTREQRDAFSGGPLLLEKLGAIVGDELREVEWFQFRGTPFAVINGAGSPVVDRADLFAAASDAMPGVPIVERSVLERYDAYYYDRNGDLPLPVLRVRFADPVGTWLYIDPRRAAIVRKEERLTRINRWLYHGLHSLDFPWLHTRRPLWDIVVIFLSLGGIGSAITSLAPAWRRLRRHAQRLYT